MTAIPSNTTERKSLSILQSLMRFREVSILLFIMLLMLLVTIRTPAFLTLENQRDIFLNISILVIVALAQTMVIITRGIDLSVGAMF